MKFAALLFIIFSFSEIRAQNDIQPKLENGVESRELQTILMSENITFETLSVNGALKDKQYQVSIQEFKNGKLIGEVMLFAGTESEYFWIKKDSLSLHVITKTERENLFIQLTGNGFTSRKLRYQIYAEKGKYVVKDFLGENNKMHVHWKTVSLFMV